MPALTLKSVYSLALLLTVLAGCSSTPTEIDERYTFKQFQQVDKIFEGTDLSSWQYVDQQSLILSKSPKRYYLLVLQRRLSDLRANEAIHISRTSGTIHARFDDVEVVNFSHGINSMPASIARIYELPGKDAVKEARTQILGSDKE